MSSPKEALDKIRELAKSAGLELREAHRITGRMDAFYLKFANGEKEVDLTLTGLQLEQSTNAPGQLSAFLGALQKRFHNTSPKYFMCRSGIPVEVEFQWPLNPVMSAGGGVRAAVCTLTKAANLRESDSVTRCALVMTYLEHEQTPPLSIPMAFTNRFRTSVDLSAITFYAGDTLPGEFPYIEPQPELQPASSHEIREFLKAKVYWLAFKQGGKNTKVWIADPWDASYLKTEAKVLLQTAEILEAEGFIEVNDEFAKPSSELLRRSAELEGRPRPTAIPT